MMMLPLGCPLKPTLTSVIGSVLDHGWMAGRSTTKNTRTAISNRMNDLYDVLGCSRNDDEATLKKAFRKKSMEHHPDRNPGDPDAARRFALVMRAWKTLGDEKARKQYDETGKEGE